MQCGKHSSGFTLVELMIVVAVLAILLTLGFPNFQGVIRSNRIATSSNELMAAFNFARSTAIRSSSWVSICASSDGATCQSAKEEEDEDAGGSPGWLIFTDKDGNGDGKIGTGDEVQRFVQANSKVKVTASASALTFDARGRRKSATDQTIVLQPADDCGEAPLRRVVTVSATGSLKLEKKACL